MWIGIVCQRVRLCVCIHTWTRMCILTYILMYVHTCGDADGDCVSDGASLRMNIHRYVCIFIYIRIYVHACGNAEMRIASVCQMECLCALLFMLQLLPRRVCMYACMHVCMYACMHECIFACMHACI